MLHVSPTGRVMPAAAVALGLRCLAAVLFLSPPPALAQDGRYHVLIETADQPGPSAAYAAAATYDTARRTFVIAGGFDPPNKNAPRVLLQYDLHHGTWSTTEFADPSPDAMGKPATVYDSQRDALFLFGGWAPGATEPSDQLWTMPLAGDGAPSWQLVDVGQLQPPPRNGCVMVLDQQGDRLVVHGGDGGSHPTYGFTPLDDLWAFDLTKQRWSRLNPRGQAPEARWNHAGTVDHEKRKMFIFGGSGHIDGEVVRDNCVFELDLDSLAWTRHAVRGDPPTPLMGATMTYDVFAHVLVVVGGLSLADAGPAGSRSLWLFDLNNNTWIEYPDLFATTRRDHTAIYDRSGRRHLVHGGMSAAQRGNYYAYGEPLHDTVLIFIIPKLRIPL